MKKLVFMFALLLGTSFVSCNQSSKSDTESTDTVTVDTVDTITGDTVLLDTVQATH